MYIQNYDVCVDDLITFGVSRDHATIRTSAKPNPNRKPHPNLNPNPNPDPNTRERQTYQTSRYYAISRRAFFLPLPAIQRQRPRQRQRQRQAHRPTHKHIDKHKTRQNKTIS
jgi:hypothetical protein